MPVVNFYTIPLCVCDCAVLSGSFLMNSLPHLLYDRMKTYGWYVPLYPCASYFLNFAYTSCVWLVVSLSVERYFAICHPLKHNIYDARRRSIVMLASCLMAAALYSVPRYLEITTVECYELTAKKMVALLAPAKFRNLKSYWVAYRVVMGLGLVSLGPFLLLCFLSIRMWREVTNSRRLALQEEIKRTSNAPGESSSEQIELITQQLSARETSAQKETEGGSSKRVSATKFSRDGGVILADKQRRALSYTLFCVVAKFVICHILPTAIDLCEMIMEEEQFRQPLVEDLVDTSVVLVRANSSFNIFLYAWCNGGFRDRLKKLLLTRTPRFCCFTLKD